MNRLAKVLRARRSERGALQLASPEVKFKIDDETTDPMDVGMYQVGGPGAKTRECRGYSWLGERYGGHIGQVPSLM